MPETIETTARDVTPARPTGPRPIPRDAAVALFAQWYDQHEADQDAAFLFKIRDGGRHMEVATEERLVKAL